MRREGGCENEGVAREEKKLNFGQRKAREKNWVLISVRNPFQTVKKINPGERKRKVKVSRGTCWTLDKGD